MVCTSRQPTGPSRHDIAAKCQTRSRGGGPDDVNYVRSRASRRAGARVYTCRTDPVVARSCCPPPTTTSVWYVYTVHRPSLHSTCVSGPSFRVDSDDGQATALAAHGGSSRRPIGCVPGPAKLETADRPFRGRGRSPSKTRICSCCSLARHPVLNSSSCDLRACIFTVHPSIPSSIDLLIHRSVRPHTLVHE